MVMLQPFQPTSFAMNQAEVHSHPAVCKTNAYSARDYCRLYKVTVVLFSMMHYTPLGLDTIHPAICMGRILFIDFFTVSFRYLQLRQVAFYS